MSQLPLAPEGQNIFKRTDKNEEPWPLRGQTFNPDHGAQNKKRSNIDRSYRI
jgi:hypothetical protein